MTAEDSRRAASVRWHTSQAGKQRVKEYSKEYYEANKGQLQVGARQYRERSKVDNPKSIMLRRSRHRAKQAGIDFCITVDDIQIPDRCPVLNIELRISNKLGGDDNSPSIDRIDNDNGYVPGNVRVISNRANKLKSNATLQELKLLLEDAREIHGHTTIS